jgi:hypothetical protein
MNKIVSLFCITFFLFCLQEIANGQELKITYPTVIATSQGRVANTLKEGQVSIKWETNFKAKEVNFTATIIRNRQTTTDSRFFKIGDNTSTIKRVRSEITDTGTGIEQEFETLMPYGESPLDANTDSLTIFIEALDSATNSKVSQTAKIVLTNIKDYYQLSKNALPKAAPIIDWVEGTKETTDSIKVSASADQTISAEAIAYQTNSVDAVLKGATGLDIKAKSKKAIAKGETTEFELTKLEAGKPYVILIREIDPPSERVAALSKPIVKNTSAISSRPSISWRNNESVVNIQNSQIDFSVRVSRAKEIVVKLFEFDTSINQWVESISKTIATPEAVSQDNKEIDKRISIPLKPDGRYKVAVNAISPLEGVESAKTSDSEEFKGITTKLFDDIQLDLSTTAIKLTPTKVTDNVKLTATAQIGNFTVRFTCPTVGSKTPSCQLETSDANFLQSIRSTESTPDQAGSGLDLLGTNVTPGQVRGFMRVTLTANADDKSERTQSQSFELAFTAAKKDSLGKKFATFADSVLNNKNQRNDALEPEQISGSGIGKFFGILLRILL